MNGETAEDLIVAAAKAGFTVTKTQLARAHRAGLLPRPLQEHLGHGRGTRSVYPVGTSVQLLRLYELKKRRRKFEHLAWMLWWEGFDIDIDVVRPVLVKVARDWVDQWSLILTPTGALTDTAEEFLDVIDTAGLGSRTLGRMRRRAGSENFADVMDGMFHAMTGHEIRADQAANVVRAAGLDLAQTDSLPGTQPWLDGDPLEGIRVAGTFMQPDRILDTATNATHDELRATTDMVRDLMAMFGEVDSFLSRMLGRWALGFGLHGAIAADTRDNPFGQALIVLFLLGLRNSDVGVDAAPILEAASGLRETNAALEAIDELGAAIPEIGDVVNRKRLAKAMRDPAEAALLEEETVALREEYAAEIDAVLKRQGHSGD